MNERFKRSLLIENLLNVKFKDVKLVPGDSESPFYLDIGYEVENMYGYFEIWFKKVDLKNFIPIDKLPNVVYLKKDEDKDEEFYNVYRTKEICYCQKLQVDIEHYIFPTEKEGVLSISDFNPFDISTIKLKDTKEVTMEEIEKKFGCKVKIVNKKENRN